MATVFDRRSYVGVTVTLTTANHNYLLKDLIDAALQAQNSSADTIVQSPGACRQVTLQSFPGVDGSGANTNDILVGDANLSATNMAFVMAAVGGAYQDSANHSCVDVGGIYVRSAGASQKLNVEIKVA